MLKVIILGAGGHAKVILDILLKQKEIFNKQIEIGGFLDDDDRKTEVFDIPIIGRLSEIRNIKASNKDIRFIVGVGDNKTRKLINNIDSKLNLEYYTAIHPNAIIGNYVKVGEGSVIMGGAVVNPGAYIGRHSIVNTSATIEHDVTIGNYAHISPGANCAGGVKVGRCTHIGTGANIIPDINIGEYSVIGAGSVVTKDIPSYCTAVGVPAKPIKFHDKED